VFSRETANKPTNHQTNAAENITTHVCGGYNYLWVCNQMEVNLSFKCDWTGFSARISITS